MTKEMRDILLRVAGVTDGPDSIAALLAGIKSDSGKGLPVVNLLCNQIPV